MPSRSEEKSATSRGRTRPTAARPESAGLAPASRRLRHARHALMLPGAAAALAALGGCARPVASVPSPTVAARAYARALRGGARSDLEALSSQRARSSPIFESSLGAGDRADVADAIDRAVTACESVPSCAREIRADMPGARAARLVTGPDGWRLAALPLGQRNATVEEALAAFLQALDQRDPDALLLLLGDRRQAVAREIGERADAVRSRRGAPEVTGSRARVRVADSWWLLLEATPSGWRVVGAEP